MWDSIAQDVRQGLRALRHRPAFTAIAVLTLALGIGVNTAMFSVINAVLLRPLRFEDPDRLVLLRDLQPPGTPTPVSYPEYLDWKGREDAFSDVAAYFRSAYFVSGDETENVFAVRMSSNMLPMLGIAPALGRGFRPEEEARRAEPVALISDAYWRRHFGADPNAVGKTLTLDGMVVTVVGVLPPGLGTLLPEDVEDGSGRDLWLPLRLDEENAPRGLHFVTAIARLREGVDLAAAQSRADAFAAARKADGTTDHGARLVPLKTHVVGGVRPALWVLFGAVFLVLLIACGNVANLLLSRAVARRREIAVRMALGARRPRLVRQLLVESLVLAVLGGAAGLVLAAWGVALLVAAKGDWLPRAQEIRLDPAVLAFTLLASVLTALLFGMAPALRGTQVALAPALKSGGGRDALGAVRDRLRGAMVVVEVALSLVLLAGAGLLLRSFALLLATDPGFNPSRVLTFNLAAPRGAYAEPQQQARLFREVLERLAALPGADGVAAVYNLPLGGGSTDGSFGIEGRTWPRDAAPNADKQMVSPAYFQVMQTPLLKGRFFTDHDDAAAPQVAIVSKAFADRYFPGEDPIGRRIDFEWETKGFQEIVGVVADMRQLGLDVAAPAVIYVPDLQRPESSMSIVIRSKTPPEALLGSARQAVRGVDPSLPLVATRTLEEVVAASLTARRLPMLLLGGLALLALLLGVVGIYGVTSFAVAQRTPEIGMRMALGARPRDVLSMVLGQGMRLVLMGTVLGTAGALALTRLLGSLLYGVGASDPPAFLGAAAFLSVVSLLACWVPARRATRVDP
ncbi:MAG TPA: ABC transporter permease, partial [Candidatus Cryosericum sp.]|nr:ABC transporter permease [Candidatus Cryosericum sp.]